jgi:phosphate/sulfate permease
MDTLGDVVNALISLSHVELMLGLLLTSTVIVVLKDWRLNLWALIAQFVLVGVLLAWVMPLRVALIKVIVGGIACVILYLTARRVHWGQDQTGTGEHNESQLAEREVFSMDLWFRILIAILAAVVSYALGTRHPFADQQQGISQACYWLLGMGLLTVVLARDSFKVGLGLLTFQSGFGILLASFEQSLSVAALVGAVDLLIALGISYVTSAQAAFPVEDDRA